MITRILLISSLLLAMTVRAEGNPAVEAIEDYLEFAEYSEGSISTDQLASIDTKDIFFVDTRNKGQYDAGHIPGAVNIEWRETLSRREEIPTDRPVVLYCETGILSSKAHFALKIAGRDNVKVLWGGYLMWSARQSFDEAKKQDKKPYKAIQPTH
jgi:rhodanese-related sulfurtransferase